MQDGDRIVPQAELAAINGTSPVICSNLQCPSEANLGDPGAPSQEQKCWLWLQVTLRERQ